MSVGLWFNEYLACYGDLLALIEMLLKILSCACSLQANSLSFAPFHDQNLFKNLVENFEKCKLKKVLNKSCKRFIVSICNNIQI